MNLEEWRARIESLRPRDAGLVHETMRDIAEAHLDLMAQAVEWLAAEERKLNPLVTLTVPGTEEPSPLYIIGADARVGDVVGFDETGRLAPRRPRVSDRRLP